MTEIQYCQGRFRGSDGTQRYKQSWHPTLPKGIVVIVHGYAEHSARYANLATYLTRQDFAVYTFDLLGHGCSEGKRGCVKSFSPYMDDLEIFLTQVHQQEPGLPLFLLGHSMGGAIAALFAIQLAQPPQQTCQTIQGLILSAPFLQVQGAALLGYPLSVLSLLAPQMPTIWLDSRAISRNVAVVQQYQTDPLVYRQRLPVQMVVAILQATRQIWAQQQHLNLPLLILHGTADRIAKITGSQKLYAQAQSADKTLKFYEGLYHEVLNESEPQVLADLTEWLNAHLP